MSSSKPACRTEKRTCTAFGPLSDSTGYKCLRSTASQMTRTRTISGVRASFVRKRGRRAYAQASGFSPTLQSLQATHVDVMVLGDLHLREDTLDAFHEARDQMKVLLTLIPCYSAAMFFCKLFVQGTLRATE